MNECNVGRENKLIDRMGVMSQVCSKRDYHDLLKRFVTDLIKRPR